MRYLTPSLVVITAILAFGCAPMPIRSIDMVRYSPSTLPETALCVILDQEDSVVAIESSPIGRIGFEATATLNPLGRGRIRQKFLRPAALKNGANLVIVSDYVAGMRWHNGLLANARLYRVPDVRQYEKVIPWSATRRLQVADFKASTPSPQTAPAPSSRSNGDVELHATIQTPPIGKPKWQTQALFLCRSSWIDANPADTARLLAREQSRFDLCEAYCRQLDRQLRQNRQSRRVVRAIFQQIDTAFIAALARCDSSTGDTSYAGLTSSSGDTSATVRLLLTQKQQDSAARIAVPPANQALVYFIGPTRYRAAKIAGANDPFCPRGVFGYFDGFEIDDGYSPPQQIKSGKFTYKLLAPGNYTFTARNQVLTACRVPESLQLSIEANRTYYIKFSVIKPGFFGAPHPRLMPITVAEGKKEIKRYRVAY